jgi:effector-binding domain-containing protein
MKVDIVEKNLRLDIYGFSGVAVNKDYSGTAFRLMDKMWQTVKTKELKNKGINIWVYEPNEKVFAGVELYDSSNRDTGLEHKAVDLPRYAYYKHVGPYSLLKKAGQNMIAELKIQGFDTILPYIEIYGHWTNDETKLETELLMCLK